MGWVEFFFRAGVPLVGPQGRWAKLSGMVMCRNTRTLKDKVEVNTRYYITSGKGLNAQAALAAVRSHWGIENQLHWMLDTFFGKDASRIHKDHAPENMALVKRQALNLLRADPDSKGSVKTKRLRAGWNEDYLLELLTGQHYYMRLTCPVFRCGAGWVLVGYGW